ncbi:hypothetical protein GCM10025857_16330 [Alicyclobacillus contaminans]|uniref:S41 family peptidase n=1 Tax=Alicyclobacillus contaminans TaxID=392016 RepID=UPI00041E0A80|nr:S41 family peptidase [Alicyclobacillus contaminans]GMA50276.1 hypothetical protein GCM10025857_16330 [Alicyclobacillus contaminans]
MERTRTRFRSAAANVVLGIAIGVAGTLVGMKAAGVRLQPGLDSPAFQKFFTVYNDLHQNYYKSESDSLLLNGAVDGMAKALGDPFTEYLPPADATQLQDLLAGSYVGIGIEVTEENGQLKIASVTPNAPAAKAGLKVNDIITAVNGTSLKGVSLEKASTLLLGPKGSVVKLTVERPGHADSPLTFSVERADVNRQTVYSRMLDHHIGYLQIAVVAEHTPDELKKQLAALEKAGAERLIVDVRDNPGGYLDQAVAMAGCFIPKGKVVVQWVDRAGHKNILKSPGPGIRLPVVVLMNGNTASAAEILSAALHEDLGAPLVGTKSFGKGTAQTTVQFSDGSSFKYTVAKWLTPNGEWIHGKGLQPTVPVADSEAAATSAAPAPDPQLAAAERAVLAMTH